MGNSTLRVKSHKDIEVLVESWDGFSLDENFRDETGSCFINDERPNMQTPWPKTKQVYRFIMGKENGNERRNHRYALVAENGEIILSARLSFTGVFCYSYDIRGFTQKYVQLKRHLEKAGILYTSDTEFEEAVIEAGNILEQRG